MNIAELRMVARKANEEMLAKAAAEKAQKETAKEIVLVPHVNPVTPVMKPTIELVEAKPVKEIVVDSHYVVIEEEPAVVVEEPIPVVAKEVKQPKKRVSSVLGRFVTKKAESTKEAVEAPVEAEVSVPPMPEPSNFDTKELLRKIDEEFAKREILIRDMKCVSCNKVHKVTSSMMMFKTGRCPACTENLEPANVVTSLYGIKVEEQEEAPKKKGLRFGGVKKDLSDLGLDLSEIM